MDAIRLLSNSRQTFLSLVRAYLNRDQKEDARFILEEMEKRIPPEVVPYTDERAALAVDDHYRRAGAPSDYERHLENVIQGKRMRNRDLLYLARIFAQVYQDWDRSEAKYLRLIAADPSNMEAHSGLFQVYVWSRQYEKGIQLLEDWLARHPEDTNAQKELARFKNLVKRVSSAQNPSLPDQGQ